MTDTTTTPRRPGRPKDPNKRKMYSFRITDENRAYLQSQPREAGELINRLLADHREKTAFLQARKKAIEMMRE